MPENLSTHEPIHANVETEGAHHVVSIATYMKVFWALMGLLILTLVAAAIDIGPLNLPIALTIAFAKAWLVIAYFMHLKFNTALVRFMGMAAVFWLLLLFGLTLADYATRNWYTVPRI
jgi:cytochrome c oxidase subunit IV